MKDYTKKILKKRLLGYGGVALALALLLALTLPGRNNGPAEDSTQNSSATSGSTRPAAGSVNLFTCDKGLYSGLCTLAEAYTGQTGIPVTVLTGAHADLDTLMATEQAPTLFCLHSQADMEKWQHSLHDLSAMALTGQLCSQGFALTLDGKKLALTMDFVGCGLIYNARLLGGVATWEDIYDFTTLELYSQLITDNLGCAAFASIDLVDTDHNSMFCRTLGMLQSAETLRNFWDLYLENSSDTGQGLDEFLRGEAVFYVGTTRDYGTVSALGSEYLDFLPAYPSDDSGLQCISTLAWGISSKASAADIQQSLAFWQWLVTAGENSPAPVDSLGLLAPFRDAASYSNSLEKKLRGYLATTPIRASWDSCEMLTQAQREALSQALAAYSDNPTDESWQAVADAFAGAAE